MKATVWAVREALSFSAWRLAPSRISMTNREEVQKRNFAVAYLTDETEGVHFLLSYVNTKGAVVRRIPADEHSREVVIDNDILPTLAFEVTHYFKQLEIRYSSPLEYLIHRRLGIIYFYYWQDLLRTAMHGRRRLVRHDRMTVLRRFVDATMLRGDDATFSELSIMSELHGPQWTRHSNREQMQRYYELVLASLNATQDLEPAQYSAFRLTAHGMATLAVHETDDRRHRQNVRTQWTLAFLTAALIIVGVGQVVVDLMNGEHTQGLFAASTRGAKMVQQNASSDNASTLLSGESVLP